MKKYFAFLACFSSYLISFSQVPLKLIDKTVQIKNRITFKLKIPELYDINVAAEGLERPRFFAKSPDGRLFVTDMHNKSDNNQGRVLILEDWNEKEKRFKKLITYLSELDNPNQVAFYRINDTMRIYIAETEKLSYYVYRPGDERPKTSPVVIATFPDYGLNYKYGGWHLTRSIAFHNNKIYISIGSSCDACIETEEIRATIVEMDPEGRNQRIYARGVRNAVGIKWINNKLWVTHMGRDNRGPDKPEELFHPIDKDGFYGWS